MNASLRSLVALFGAIPQPPADEVRRQLEEVFARPEFHPQDENFLLRWFGELLRQFFTWLGSLYDVSPVLFWVLLIGCVVLLALLVGHITWTIRRVWFTGGAGREEGAQEQRQRLSLWYQEEAQRQATAEDFTEAIRCLFLALVYRFDESGRVNFQQAYTNREYLDLCADRPEVQQGLRVFVDILDDHWYGQRPSARTQYENCRTLYDRLIKV